MNLKTIAEKAGVSTATFSNVINGNHHKVSQKTIMKVQKIIEENDYKPNATARSLASKKSRIIGVVVTNINEKGDFFANPHYAHLLALLEKDIRSQGYFMMMRCVERCVEIIPLFSSWNVDGMIFFGTFRDEVEEIREQVDVPVVFIDTYAEDLPVANVGIDDYKGGYLAAKYLLDRGHTQIALVGPRIRYNGVMKHRFTGFWDACREKGIPVQEDRFYESDAMFECGVEAGKRIADAPIEYTAAAVMSDIIAFGVMEGLRQKGKNVPEDVSVIGFDDLLECRYTNPQLTSVSQKLEQKAEAVGRTLFQLIREEGMLPINEIGDVEIIERRSVRNLNE